MSKVVRIALLLIGILAVAVASIAAPTKAQSHEEAVIALQIATAEATELRTWPGTQFNYQKAYVDWARADDQLTADIRGGRTAAFNWHVARLVFRRRVGVADAARLMRLSLRAR